MTEPVPYETPQDDCNIDFIDFDYRPFEDIVWRQKLGSGSFGLVHRGKQPRSSLILDGHWGPDENGLADIERCLTIAMEFAGTYLGIDIAIKEILPSSEYDVSVIFHGGISIRWLI